MSGSDNPYIILAQQYWFDDLGSNARNFATEIAKTRPVLYVNPALDIATILRHGNTPQVKRRLRSVIKRNQPLEVAPNIWVLSPSAVFLSINWSQSVKLFDGVNQKNAKAFFSDLKIAVKQLGWQPSQCVVLNDSQMFVGNFTRYYFKPLLNFYYIRDNLVHHPYFQRHGSRLEPITIKEADAVFANSLYLADYARPFNADSTDIGQGCDLDMYDPSQQLPEPDDLRDIPHPRIGYTGFLTGERLDIALLETLATANESWHFVLVGPEEIMFQQSRLHGMPNVHFTGSKKTTELAAYLQHFDVCMNPQLLNELTVGNYPRKIDEYLAMGKPVVATDTPAMKMFLPHVHLAEGSEAAYTQAIHAALQQHNDDKARAAIAFAKSHTWANCLDKIYQKQIEKSNVQVHSNTVLQSGNGS